jgi:hypothetical protein
LSYAYTTSLNIAPDVKPSEACEESNTSKHHYIVIKLSL